METVSDLKESLPSTQNIEDAKTAWNSKVEQPTTRRGQSGDPV